MQTAIRARVSDGVELGPVHHLGAGYVAGAMMVLATNPVWMIKTRMQLQDRNAKASGVRPYSGLIGESFSLPAVRNRLGVNLNVSD